MIISNKSQWSLDVLSKMDKLGMSLEDLSEKTGIRPRYLYSVINGRYANGTIDKVSCRINDVLGTKGRPERVKMPSDEWCNLVKIELIKRGLKVKDLASAINVKYDSVSNIINGKCANKKTIDKINDFLYISVPVFNSNAK